MNDRANYDSGPGKIPPESGNEMAMSDFADDIDAELGEPSLPSEVHLDMSEFANILTVCRRYRSAWVSVTRGCLVRPGRSPWSPEIRWLCRILLVTLILCPVGPPCRRGFHSDMADIDDIDSASQVTECVGFSDPGLPCREDPSGVRESDGGVGFSQ